MEVDEYKVHEAMKNIHSDNLLLCLLLLDGMSMINVDIIKKLDEISPLLGVNFTDLLFDLMNDKFLDSNTKEIASHLAALDMMTYENTPDSRCRELMEWTYNYYIEKKRENSLTSNLSLILTHDACVDFLINHFDEKKDSYKSYSA